jgi:hypothetical protein
LGILEKYLAVKTAATQAKPTCVGLLVGEANWGVDSPPSILPVCYGAIAIFDCDKIYLFHA